MDIKHQDTGASKPAAEKHGSVLSERSPRMPNRQSGMNCEHSGIEAGHDVTPPYSGAAIESMDTSAFIGINAGATLIADWTDRETDGDH